jgi:hypothetical protein
MMMDPIIWSVDRLTTNSPDPRGGGLNTHRPLLVLLQPADWGAAMAAFNAAVCATGNNGNNGKQVAMPPPRLALRLRGSNEKVVASFVPTDEEGMVLCTLTRSG